MTGVRVLLVDDHAVLRRSIRALLEARLAGATVGEAASSDEAIARVAGEPVDVVLLDLALGNERGFETLRRIKQARNGVAVLVMSMHPEEQYGAAARAAGATGYIVKGAPPDDIVAAVSAAVRAAVAP